MVSFGSDYVKGCHPKVLEKLTEINDMVFAGYGTDTMCEQAAEKIRRACGCPDAVVKFIAGGTQTNQLAIDCLLDPTEGVVALDTGHISTHEAGAVEYSGHKVLTLPHHNGLMDPKELKTYLETFFADGNHEHMVYPGMVYITFATEFGTIYTREALKEISDICHEYDIPLYIDGARLGYGLAASDGDVTLKDIAELSDAFYIGGTKVGALFGEALVFTTAKVPKNFVARIKQHGALLAKGWIAGTQFDVLFTDDLFMKLSRNGVEQAKKIRKFMTEAGYPVFMESPSNQQFFVIEDSEYETFVEKLDVRFWEKYDETHTVIRLVASFATTDEDIAALEQALKEM